jgi:large subunit ribosomal protein L15
MRYPSRLRRWSDADSSPSPQERLSTTGFRYRIEVVNVGELNAAFEEGATVTHEAPSDAGLVSTRPATRSRSSAMASITRKAHLPGPKVSAAAKEKIEKAGGSIAA